ncbi:MAG: hypothetical protein HOC74_06365 [Gemmatimonadetes bacterium]|jgi:hypothetical protein|nr:hypothetical protein [Gemmatimonadota bacterium]
MEKGLKIMKKWLYLERPLNGNKRMTSPLLQHRDCTMSRPVFRSLAEKSALSTAFAAASIAATAALAAAAAAAQSDPEEGP